MRKVAFIFILFLFLSYQQSSAQNRRPVKTDGAKFGFFDVEEPAAGVAFNLGHLSPHLRLNFDGDLIFSGQPRVILDLSLRYLFNRQRHTRPYIGGGAGIALGDDNSVPAHFVGGFDFAIDTLPVFIELKIHLSNPDAVSLWFGLRF
jgi:hypothetical protein